MTSLVQEQCERLGRDAVAMRAPVKEKQNRGWCRDADADGDARYKNHSGAKARDRLRAKLQARQAPKSVSGAEKAPLSSEKPGMGIFIPADDDPREVPIDTDKPAEAITAALGVPLETWLDSMTLFARIDGEVFRLEAAFLDMGQPGELRNPIASRLFHHLQPARPPSPFYGDAVLFFQDGPRSLTTETFSKLFQPEAVYSTRAREEQDDRRMKEECAQS